MASAVQITGLTEFRDKLIAVKSGLPGVMWEATIHVVEFVEEQAKGILDELLYSQPRKPFEPELDYSLRDESWYTEILEVGYGVQAELMNTHKAAIFIEGGTVAHGVVPVNAPKLIFIDPDEGHLRREDEVYVSGVIATYFLSDAVNLHLLEIQGIYRNHLQMFIRSVFA